MSATRSSKKPAPAPAAVAPLPSPAPTPETAQRSQEAPALALTGVVEKPPPIDLTIPAGFVPVDITYFVGVLPKGAQLAVMARAVEELRAFPDYTAVFGKTAPPYATVLAAFDVAEQWSSVRTQVDAFDVYAASQEALSWAEVEGHIARLQQAWELAVTSDATIGTDHPALTGLFGAKKAIAQKGAATKKANAKAKAEGKPPTKGKVGKRRRAAAAKALLDAATNGTNPAAAGTPATAPPAKPPTNGGAPNA